MNRGLLVVVSGFSGAGKGTLMKSLLSKYDNYALSISATTRKPREGEQHGKEYFFVSKEEFEDMIHNDELIEYAGYVDNYYGTPKKYVINKLAEGLDVILEIEIQGALKIKQTFPEAILVFVTPPDAATLKSRLLSRGTETEEQINKRLLRASEESSWIDNYDYIVVNDDLNKATEDLHSLICSQHLKTCFNRDFVNTIKNDMLTSYQNIKEDS